YRPEFLFPLPARLSAEEGAMLEPLGVALYSWDMGAVRVAETVAVVGCGPIGLLIVQLARLAGAARVLAVEPLAYRRALAARFGAIPLEPTDDLERVAADLTHGYGVDVAFEAAGTVAAPELAARMLKRGGTLVLTGIPAEDELRIQHHLVRRKEVTIRMVRRMKLTYPRAIALVESGMLDVAALVTHRFSLDQAATAFQMVEDYADGVIKAVIRP
ncbi:MAG: zinc-binding dehydrogenase, partial [Chloroflexi bacterium]|nr:zinc-binding dehydrogenase [Chloroflexota bacterium]